MGSFDQHESAEKEKTLTTEQLLAELVKQKDIYKFIDDSDLQALSTTERLELKEGKTKSHPKLDEIAEEKLKKVYEQIKQHPLAQLSYIQYYGTQISVSPKDPNQDLLTLSCFADGSARPNHLSVRVPLSDALDDYALMIHAIKHVLKNGTDNPEEPFNLSGNTLEWDKKDQFFDEELGEIKQYPNIFEHVINARYRNANKRKKLTQKQTEAKQEKAAAIKRKTEEKYKKEIEENKAWKERAQSYKQEEQQLMQNLREQYTAGKKPNLKNSFFQSERYTEGVPEEHFAPAEQKLETALKTLEAQKPTPATPEFLQKILSVITPKGSYKAFQASAVFALSNLDKPNSQNCSARAYALSIVLSELYPDQRNKIFIQEMGGHRRVLFEIKGEKYIMEGRVHALSQDNWSLTSNYLLGPVDNLLMGYAGLNAKWEYIQNGVPSPKKTANNLTNENRKLGIPNLELSLFRYSEYEDDKPEDFYSKTETNTSSNETQDAFALESPIIRAVQSDNIQFAEEWLNMGGDPNYIHNGIHILDYIADTEIRLLFIQEGANFNEYLEYCDRQGGFSFKFFLLESIKRNQIHELSSDMFIKAMDILDSSVRKKYDENRRATGILQEDLQLIKDLISSRLPLSDLDFVKLRLYSNFSSYGKENLEWLEKTAWENGRKLTDPKAIVELKIWLRLSVKEYWMNKLPYPEYFEERYPEEHTEIRTKLEHDDDGDPRTSALLRRSDLDLMEKDAQGNFKHIPSKKIPTTPETIENLIKAGLDIDEKDTQGRSWSQIFILKEYGKVHSNIKDHMQDMAPDIFIKSCERYRNGDLNCIDESGRNYLFNGGMYLYESTIQALHKKGIDLNRIDIRGHSFHDHHLAMNGHYNLGNLRYSLTIGYDPVNPKRRGAFNRTHLMNLFWKQSSEGHHLKDCIDLLIEKGEDINAQDLFGRTALMYATRTGNEALIRYLIQKGADPSIKDKWGGDAESYVISSGKDPINKYILAELRKGKTTD